MYNSSPLAGIHFFESATHGGEWIIQKQFENAPCLSKLLPSGAPLSTLRIVTMSRGALNPERAVAEAALTSSSQSSQSALVEALVCVFRAGRAGASTDHNSVLFDMDMETGRIKEGSNNQHWYKLGLQHALHGAIDAAPNTTIHPDSGATITGEVIPDIATLKQTVVDMHAKLLPDVPLAGWDVAITTEGVMVLEANLSCNFFQGTFDYRKYISFVDQCLQVVDQRLARQ